MLEFVEGTLSPALSTAVRRHIDSCASCYKELEAHSSRTRALKKLGRVDAPDQWKEISWSIRRAGWVYFVRRFGIPVAIFGAVLAVGLVALNAFVAAGGGGKTPSTAKPEAADDRAGLMVADVAEAPNAGRPQPMAVSDAAPAPPEAAPQGAGTDSTAPSDGSLASGARAYDSMEADHYDSMVEQFLGDAPEAAGPAEGSVD
jgi:hypothetical protein